jgi:hypothetical protein
MRGGSLRTWIVFGVLVVVLTWRREAASEPPPPFVVIVHGSNPNVLLERAFVSDAFLKKATRWPNGDVIKPVDLTADSPARERFSRDILKRSVKAVQSYWQQVIFSGRDVPPPELAADEAMVRYVETHEGAIGYVSGSARLGGTRAVGVR